MAINFIVSTMTASVCAAACRKGELGEEKMDLCGFSNAFSLGSASFQLSGRQYTKEMLWLMSYSWALAVLAIFATG